jgi:hypothetical protein
VSGAPTPAHRQCPQTAECDALRAPGATEACGSLET